MRITGPRGVHDATVPARLCAPGEPMPRPSHRLDLVVLPDEPCRPVPAAAAHALAAAWRATPPAGARGVRVDLPARISLYANQLGGFRVRCPVSGENLVPAFGPAIAAWRGGGPRSLVCPACGAPHALESLAFSPEAAFAAGGVVLADVASADLPPAAREQAAAHLGGPVRVIARRVG